MSTESRGRITQIIGPVLDIENGADYLGYSTSAL